MNSLTRAAGIVVAALAHPIVSLGGTPVAPVLADLLAGVAIEAAAAGWHELLDALSGYAKQ